ncbi:MAG: polyphenol oxidase family protein [Acidobacteria bacterium]|nr:polyphenol oxidase family protein [Acidobacteriota bacterium]
MSSTLTSSLLSDLAGVRHGFSPDPERAGVWRPRQVHGCAVALPGDGGAARTEADAAVSGTPGLGVGVVTADCVPVLLATAGGAAVAAVHCGWRGVAAGVIERALSRLRELAPDQRVAAALGPGASGCCYEVGPEVLEALRPAPSLLAPTAGGRHRLDLRGLVAARLRVELDPRDVEMVGPCTICDPGWPSYRREGRSAGRLLAWIFPR